jgi:hypothetical protein
MATLRAAAPPAEDSSRYVRLEPAYANRAAVWDHIVADAPYDLMMALPGYTIAPDLDPSVMPWFRRYWAENGRCHDPKLDPLFRDARFIDAVREVMQTELVSPNRMMVNLMGPMGEGPPHRDTPSFRTAEPLPIWLLWVMLASELFEEWRIPSCAAVSWFYDGRDGAYEYWPDGRSAPSRREEGPFGNSAVIANNERMFHRVGAIGTPEQRLAAGTISHAATIDHLGTDGWALIEDGQPVRRLGMDELRISILWNALAFRTERAQRLYEQGEEQLTVAMVNAELASALGRRGIGDASADLFVESDWTRLLRAEFPMPDLPRLLGGAAD